MITSGILPNSVTIASTLLVFYNFGMILMGKSVHYFWIRHGFEANVYMEITLVGLYSKFGCVGVTQRLFDDMSERNVVSWNVIISGYSDNGFGEEAFCLFNLMRRNRFLVDFFTIMSLITASLTIKGSLLGRRIHGFAIKTRLENFQLVKTALMNMYVKGNCINDAYFIFNEMPVKDVVVWTLMLTGLSSGRCWNKTMEDFNKMMGVEDLRLDFVALMGILSGCSRLEALKQGRRIHGLMVKSGFANDIFMGSVVIRYSHNNNGELYGRAEVCCGIRTRAATTWA
ncbi:hypothetical protein F0562_010794 [Nyssa sinensis]|uniref:Pentatricopeptide repeat-containing protein n=1 Tax=Nyssa sinensis TaxID=561372 RepID=A0A5J5A4N3_9ASTE|nr:hypothetical protein F0562_010794 [Nyssa sinensis]